ncbi:aminodeoxychorismate synthase component I [Streptococcus porcinus]|uniref:Para-aminobenzoate synthetase componentI/4-amino-4-deoxychorismate lyase n=2 Tax=Streptococcus porcinus TaxID=1340 RepID=A0A4V0H2G4_STRPO|nr:aminodeoxychorismate synthase component I [Streptococcus porcinus]EGJ26774.1 aminodeoxychorismate synthase, component I [Streptococcus porcinus str. Jelinkova 176]SQG42723.1 para-aminobenzoate synthetase componentI/4-amino-4-deoxychorismate lyase [Streptococcus porcinus]VTT41743.1 para-aminobenzoate synthetase componentI/4-amino-4-deoxychorismate lyase [Streptococcus porcinus]VTT42895.1 para-aminobenzoate synthetase componentI/4-amino-4-deoxychorismate lyase [Streptococcus porcinus]
MHRKTIIDFKELGQRYLFENPLLELVAEELDQVGLVIEQVQYYQQLGYYVVGYLSYEAASFFDKALQTHDVKLGKEYFAYFTVHKKCQKEEFLLDYDNLDLPNRWTSATQKKAYQKAIEIIHSNMRQGNTYQVNYTIQLTQELDLTKSLSIYNKLVVEQAAGYNAYIAHDDFAVISASPELFFKQDGNTLTTKPMKGTTKRGVNSWYDKKEHDWLQADAKNRSENMMIVDLLRNDMGKICQTGSVHVAKLCELEQYSTVWQMTSTVLGKLRPTCDLLTILTALFPCGSITGAPKVSTMAIIKDLEPKPRGVYCGTIGICLPDGCRIFNVPIRTLQLTGNHATYGVGGGITWQSKWEEEYDEVHQKTAVLYRKKQHFTLKTTAKVEQKEIVFLEHHLNRLKEAATYFAYPYDEPTLRKALKIYLEKKDDASYRLTISLSKNGRVELSDQHLKPLPSSFLKAKLTLQDKDVSNSVFTYFKTSYRPHINQKPYEQVFYNKEGQLLETSIGNLFVQLGQNLYTPPVAAGILPGLFRQELLVTGQVQEKWLTLADLQNATAVFGGNTVRGLYRLDLNFLSNTISTNYQ